MDAGSKTLWFAVLGAPIAWTFHMVIGYSLEEWFACSPSSSTQGEVLGLDVRLIAALITIAFGLVALAAAVVAVRALRSHPGPGEIPSRARWMATVGLMNSILYLAIIVGGFAPAIVLSVCETSP